MDYTNAVTVAGTTIPGISMRKVQTEVELDSGQSFVIAGLWTTGPPRFSHQDSRHRQYSIVGQAVSGKTVSRKNSELLVIVTPEVVRPIAAGQPVPQVPFTPPSIPAQS